MKPENFNGDRVLYFAYLQSLIEDGDLEFRDDYLELDPNIVQHYLKRTSTGKTLNIFPPGPAILWAPFYLSGKAWVFFDGIDNRQAELTVLLRFAEFGSLIYVITAILLMYRLLRVYFSRLASVFGIYATVFLSAWLYYSTIALLESHFASTFAATLFLYAAFRITKKETTAGWVTFGLAGALLTTCRWSDIVLVIILGIWLTIELLRLHSKNPFQLGSYRGPLVGASIFTVGMLPQFVVATILYGPFKSPIDYGANLVIYNRPEIINLLFSTRHGLFSWHPLLLLAIAGLIIFLSRQRSLAVALICICLAFTYILSTIGDWWAGDAFGMRRFITLTPVFALGFAALFDHYRNRYVQISFGLALLVFGAWNYLMIVNYEKGIIEHDATPDRTNPLRANHYDKYNQFGHPLNIPGSYIHSAMLGGIDNREAEWIYTNYLFYSHHNLYGFLDIDFPSYQKGFSSVQEGRDGRFFRTLSGTGSVYVNRLCRLSNAVLRIDGEIIKKESGRGNSSDRSSKLASMAISAATSLSQRTAQPLPTRLYFSKRTTGITGSIRLPAHCFTAKPTSCTSLKTTGGFAA